MARDSRRPSGSVSDSFSADMQKIMNKIDQRMDEYDITQESKPIILELSQLDSEQRLKVLQDLKYTFCIYCGRSQFHKEKDTIRHSWCQCENDE